MKNYLSQIFVFLLVLVTFSGCTVLEDIFEAGIWIGVIIAILVLALIIWIVRKAAK